MQGCNPSWGECSEVFFLALCPVAASGHCQEKLLSLSFLSEARAESFSSEQPRNPGSLRGPKVQQLSGSSLVARNPWA